jgi:hypothetical protein
MTSETVTVSKLSIAEIVDEMNAIEERLSVLSK